MLSEPPAQLPAINIRDSTSHDRPQQRNDDELILAVFATNAHYGALLISSRDRKVYYYSLDLTRHFSFHLDLCYHEPFAPYQLRLENAIYAMTYFKQSIQSRSHLYEKLIVKLDHSNSFDVSKFPNDNICNEAGILLRELKALRYIFETIQILIRS